MDDVRYSELQFLRAIEKRSFENFVYSDERQTKTVGLSPMIYLEMAITLLEDLYVRFTYDEPQLFVARLRGELAPHHRCPSNCPPYYWDNPRIGLHNVLTAQSVQSLSITYRGLRRIEELRDLLRRERILEPFGVLLSMQYFRKDFEDALQRASDVPVSVLYADMDHFKPINTEFGQSAGDVVMKAYLEVVRDCLGLFGTAYRGVGDEVAALVIGQGHQRAVELAEAIRKGIESLHCKYKDSTLPKVTVSIGVATTPPEDRKSEVETLAESRKRQAKEKGKNRVVAG
jgi:diguanylate cyclase (GGDEF)-like protein